jgi:hypothetical protein
MSAGKLSRLVGLILVLVAAVGGVGAGNGTEQGSGGSTTVVSMVHTADTYSAADLIWN